jgi:adenosylmethionine-8-amino-7-oxononanoate aminotransferase
MVEPLPTFPVQSAKGVHIKLKDGRNLVDGMSSWWAAVHGYRNPALDQAMKDQIENSMSHVMFGGLTHRPAVELAARLLQLVNNDHNNLSATTTATTNPAAVQQDRMESLSLHAYSFNLEKMRNEYHLTKVFLSDSGSIAVEVRRYQSKMKLFYHTLLHFTHFDVYFPSKVAMKMAIQYWYHEQPRKNKFLSFRNGYHGDTMGAMSVCDPVNGMHSMFAGVLANQLFVPSPTGPRPSHSRETLAQMEITLREHHNELAAVIMEPIVQGAGGMKFYHPQVLMRVRELCDRYGVLLIFDEIATGFGRTGTLFAGWQGGGSYRPWSSLDGDGIDDNDDDDENFDGNHLEDDGIVYPDILCLGKALTGGYVTLGATLTTNEVARGISSGGGVFMHGPTFMANPLACSVSLASVNLLMSSPWEERVRRVERELIEHLSPLADLNSTVREVRVLGAIGVCELHKGLDRDAMARVQRQLVDEGVWLRPFGKLLYTMPPFNCEELSNEHIRKIGEAMFKVAQSL